MQGDSALGRALGLVRELRQRCPWDRAQSPQTLRPYLVEEALELDQAIQTDDPEAMRDELGDLLLHLAFQIVIAEERSQFNAEVVTRTLEEKMWRRHPNLFGEGRVSSDDHAGWELVKRREPRTGGKRSTLAGLPPTLPPLLKIGRASCRERVEISVVAVSLKKKKRKERIEASLSVIEESIETEQGEADHSAKQRRFRGRYTKKRGN